MVPIHPLVVHFPVAFLVVAGIAYVFALITAKELHWKLAMVFHAIGIAGAILAVLTGNSEDLNIIHTKGVEELVSLHERLGLWLAYGFGMLGVWSFLRMQSKIILEKVIFCIVFVGLAVVLAFNAHLGGRMVYERGAGVHPMEKELKNQLIIEENSENHD